MIYLDTSVALAWILAEDRRPPAAIWTELLVSSRLTEYELTVRLHAYGMTAPRSEAARDVLSRLAWVELVRPALDRALRPFPTPVRALDALHLATIDFLRTWAPDLEVASYDERMLAAARAMSVPVHPLP